MDKKKIVKDSEDTSVDFVDIHTPNESNKEILYRQDVEKIKIRKTQGTAFDKYLNDTGIPVAFQLIFTELLSKKIAPENYFSYTAARLKTIGREVEEIKNKNK